MKMVNSYCIALVVLGNLTCLPETEHFGGPEKSYSVMEEQWRVTSQTMKEVNVLSCHVPFRVVIAEFHWGATISRYSCFRLPSDHKGRPVLTALSEKEDCTVDWRNARRKFGNVDGRSVE